MWVIAHRGLHDTLRENTVAAFRAAGAAGADGVELDARVGDDGEVIVHHDPLAPGPRPAWVPTLTEALDACRGLAVVNVEIKNGGPAVGAAVRDRAGVVLSSFDLGQLAAAAAAAPGTPTAWLALPGYEPAAAIATARDAGCAGIHPADAAVDASFVGAAHAAGLRVRVWTVNDPDRMRQLAGWGVDAVITDRPDVAVAVVGAGPQDRR